MVFKGTVSDLGDSLSVLRRFHGGILPTRFVDVRSIQCLRGRAVEDGSSLGKYRETDFNILSTLVEYLHL